MANEYEIFEFLEADNSENNSSRQQRRKQMREEYQPFNLDEAEFVNRYRLTKDLVHNLCDDLRPYLKKPIKSTDLSIETKVLTALSFYASGSNQRPIGSVGGQNMAQQTVSAVISQVTASMNMLAMRQKYISFPSDNQERNRVKAEFYSKFGIPGVLGCIDCTHVAIGRPNLNKDRYCHKNYHSLNVQLICDANMQIMSVDASHGGADHDSFIWASHPLKAYLEDLSNTDNVWLLGDSAYPLERTMMVPILDAEPGTPEAHYTNLHVRARDTIERTIGLLKARFRCLLVHRVLRYAPEVAGSIINACVILHNMCNKANTPVQQLSNEDLIQERQLQYAGIIENPYSSDLVLQQGIAMRNHLVLQLWEGRQSTF